ncbi:hypothetical protein DFH09DRAFT_1083654 [Mycena vulgaris]|nr:hypothetical protein DFH09DRAFT_1083654 [Mycena vulgaris]
MVALCAANPGIDGSGISQPFVAFTVHRPTRFYRLRRISTGSAVHLRGHHSVIPHHPGPRRITVHLRPPNPFHLILSVTVNAPVNCVKRRFGLPRAQMPPATRSGAQFLPYELDSIQINGREFGIIRTSVSLDSILQQSLEAADVRAPNLDQQPVDQDECIEWDLECFKNLVIDPNRKFLIQSLVNLQADSKQKSTFDNFVAGKVPAGPPGVGKTLKAEVTNLRRPLYVLSARELGGGYFGRERRRLELRELNGWQIKNVVKLSAALAAEEGKTMTYVHLVKTLGMTDNWRYKRPTGSSSSMSTLCMVAIPALRPPGDTGYVYPRRPTGRHRSISRYGYME